MADKEVGVIRARRPTDFDRLVRNVYKVRLTCRGMWVEHRDTRDQMTST